MFKTGDMPVKIRVQHVPLHQIRISVWFIRPVWVADVFAAFPNPQAKRDVIVLLLTERNELNLLFVTGKRWPKLFEIRLVKKAATQ